MPISSFINSRQFLLLSQKLFLSSLGMEIFFYEGFFSISYFWDWFFCCCCFFVLGGGPVVVVVAFFGGSWAGGWSLLVFSYENHCDCHKKLKIKKVVIISILLSKLDHRPLFSDIYFDAILWWGLVSTWLPSATRYLLYTSC